MLPPFLIGFLAQCSHLCQCMYRGVCDKPLKHTLAPLQDVEQWTPQHVAAFVRSVAGGVLEGEPSWHQTCTSQHRGGASCEAMLHELHVLASAVNNSGTINGASFRRFLTNGSLSTADDVRTMGPRLQSVQRAAYAWLPALQAQPGHDPHSVVPALLRLVTALQEVTEPRSSYVQQPRLWPVLNDNAQVESWLARMREVGATDEYERLEHARSQLAQTDPTVRVLRDGDSSTSSSMLPIRSTHWEEASAPEGSVVTTTGLADLIFNTSGDRGDGWPPTFHNEHHFRQSRWSRYLELVCKPTSSRRVVES